MMAYYKVSRATVRKAMDMLADEGLIEKTRPWDLCKEYESKK